MTAIVRKNKYLWSKFNTFIRKTMEAEYKSKHGTVSRQPFELYMSFVDMRNFVKMIPEDKQKDVTADFDTIKVTVQGFSIGVKVSDRTPYSRISFVDDGAPFRFNVSLFFDPCSDDPFKTDFHISISAELNLMMKMMLGAKLQEGLDKIVDGLVAASEGRMPEGVDPSIFDKI